MPLISDSPMDGRIESQDAFAAVRRELSARLHANAATSGELLFDGRWVSRKTFEREMRKSWRRTLFVVGEVLALAMVFLCTGIIVLGFLAFLMGPL